MSIGTRVLLAFILAVILGTLIAVGGGLRRPPEDRRGPGPAPTGTCRQTYSATPPVSIHCQ